MYLMNLKSYINLYVLLGRGIASQEENRAFGLVHVTLKQKPTAQLLAWQAEHLSKLEDPKVSDSFVSYLSMVSRVLFVIAFFAGLLSGMALLSYNGHAPVNVIYFMAMVMALPLLTMCLSILSMFRMQAAEHSLVHFSPSFWMEKILSFLPSAFQEKLKTLEINPLIFNWIVLKRSQLIALAFSFGLLLALFGMVVTQDIAFAWSTTLEISPEGFAHFLEILSTPWHSLFPSAVPSVELVSQSQYFRLGEHLNPQMVANASGLGAWWKFLLLLTLFYALFLRLLLFLFAHFALGRAIQKSFLTLVGSRELLSEMNHSVISTHAIEREATFVTNQEGYTQVIHRLDSSYDVIHGWAMSSAKLEVLADSMQVLAPHSFEVGGTNSLQRDHEIIELSHGEVLFFVKAWEPPTLDFVDYIEALIENVEKVVIFPIGTVDNNYSIEEKMIDVWERKIVQINAPKVWLKR